MTEGIDKYLLAACGIGFAAVILLVDIMSPVGVLVPALYLLLLPIVGAFNIRHGALLFTAATALLSCVGAYLSPPSAPTAAAMLVEVIVNRALLTAAIQAASFAFLRQVALDRGLRRLQLRDPLTGLLTISAYLQEVARRAGDSPTRALVTLAFRLDDRAALARSRGDQVADAALVAVANGCRGLLPTSAIVGRYDDATVVAALPGTTRMDAQDLAERLRRHLADQPLLTGAGPVPVVVVVGLAELPFGEAVRTAVDHAVINALRPVEPVAALS